MKHKKRDILDAIIKLRIEGGKSTKWIVDEYLMRDLGYKISYSYDLLKEARDEIVKIYDKQNEALANEALGQLEAMYQVAIGTGERKLALEILKEKNKLTGVYAAEKVDLTSGGEKLTTIKLIEIKKDDEKKEDMG